MLKINSALKATTDISSAKRLKTNINYSFVGVQPNSKGFLISQEIIEELTNVLSRKKFNKYLLEEERLKFLADFLKETETVIINQNFDACRDTKDNKFIDLAVCGNAQYIIPGDDD